MSKSWTAEEDAKLIKRVKLRMTASEIAATLPGRTRNAVIGRAHKLGCPWDRSAWEIRFLNRRNARRSRRPVTSALPRVGLRSENSSYFNALKEKLG